MIAKLFPRALLAVSVVLAATPLLALMPTGPSSKFEVTAPTQVPGLTLPAGSFSLTVVDHLTDRYIVRVEDQSGGVLATFLGIPDSELSNRAGTGMILWNGSDSGSKRYMRGWSFPSQSLSLEFVYPKTEAVAIAQMNHARVAAIDPASDGLVIKSGLSKDDLQIVTLWLLTPTHVGLGDNKPGVSAARYQAPSAPSNAQLAATNPSPVKPLSIRQAQAAPVARPIPRVQPVPPTQVARLEAPVLPTSGRRTMIARLPKTASDLGWFWLIGSVALVGAAGLRLRRLA